MDLVDRIPGEHGRVSKRTVKDQISDKLAYMIHSGLLRACDELISARTRATPLQKTRYLKLDGKCIALTSPLSKPLSFISLDLDRIALLGIESLKVLRYIATQKEPDVSKVVML